MNTTRVRHSRLHKWLWIALTVLVLIPSLLLAAVRPVFAAGEAATITIIIQPASGGGSVDEPLTTQPVVNVVDAFATPVDDGTIVTATVSGGGSGVLRNDTAVTSSGNATFVGLGYSKSGEGFKITFSCTTGTPVESDALAAMTPGAATHLHVTGIPDEVAAGTPSYVTVTAHDQYDNVARGYLGNITFTSSDVGGSTVLPANYTFTGAGFDNGVHTFNIPPDVVTLTTAGGQSVTATDTDTSSINGTQTDITVTHGAATQYVILNPADGTVDVPITVTVQLQDQYGNVCYYRRPR